MKNKKELKKECIPHLLDTFVYFSLMVLLCLVASRILVIMRLAQHPDELKAWAAVIGILLLMMVLRWNAVARQMALDEEITIQSAWRKIKSQLL